MARRGQNEITITDITDGQSVEIMYSNDPGAVSPGNPTTMPMQWQSSSDFSSGTAAPTETWTYNEADTGFISNNVFNFRDAAGSGSNVLTGSWPTTGTAWLRFDSTTADNTLASYFGFSTLPTTPTAPSSTVTINLTDGTNSATYVVSQLGDSGSDEDILLNLTNEVVVGTPVSGTSYTVTITRDVIIGGPVRWVAQRIGTGEWQVSRFGAGDEGTQGVRGASFFSIMRDGTPPDPITAPTDAEVNMALGIATGPVQGDVATILYADSAHAFVYNGTTWGDAATRIDGDLVVDGTIAGSKLQADSVFTNTLRSNNYVAPTLEGNPPNRGYSLEHVEGIGFFQELRANLTGAVTVPTSTPTSGTHTYNTSFVQREYLNVSQGDAFTDFNTFDRQGNPETYRMIVSNPLLTFQLPTSPEVDVNPFGVPENWSGGIGIRRGASYLWYYTLTAADPDVSFAYDVGVLPIGYNAAGEMVGFLASTGGFGIREATFGTETINAFDTTSTTQQVEMFIRAGAVFAGAEIPTEVRIHFVLASEDDITTSSSAHLTSPISISAGIRLNSSVSFTVNSVDGSSSTTQVTQGAA